MSENTAPPWTEEELAGVAPAPSRSDLRALTGRCNALLVVVASCGKPSNLSECLEAVWDFAWGLGWAQKPCPPLMPSALDTRDVICRRVAHLRDWATILLAGSEPCPSRVRLIPARPPGSA